MVTFVKGPVRATVPASSANLGPGFDSLGLALAMYDQTEAEVIGEGLEVIVAGVGARGLSRDESHLVVRAMRAAFTELGGQPPGLRVACQNVIPHARGLGSSSAAIVAGLLLARGLVTDGAAMMSDFALFQLAAKIEGHPDNVAPALFGGFTISGMEGGEHFAVPAPVDPRLSAVVFVPPRGLSTEMARGLLPLVISHADAAANAGRTALLVAAMAGQPEHLHAAMRDYLHQSYRRPAMPDSLDLVEALRAEGFAAAVSGAGPSVVALVADRSQITGPHGLLAHCPDGWKAQHLEVDRAGALLD